MKHLETTAPLSSWPLIVFVYNPNKLPVHFKMI